MTDNVLLSMMKYFGSDVPRINHALKVYGFAKAIIAQENLTEDQATITKITSIIHDIGIKNAELKYHSSAGAYQEKEGPPVARILLGDLGFSEAIIERVCFIIANHHSYNKIDGIDFQILVEADFLVNVFEDGIKRNPIEIFKNKYFKTKTGTHILDQIYSTI